VTQSMLMSDELELWRRDPVECIKDLLQNPAFRDVMAYAPERVYRDKEGKRQVYDKMWTSDWWWEVQ
jgi:Plavaka transposase